MYLGAYKCKQSLGTFSYINHLFPANCNFSLAELKSRDERTWQQKERKKRRKSSDTKRIEMGEITTAKEARICNRINNLLYKTLVINAGKYTSASISTLRIHWRFPNGKPEEFQTKWFTLIIVRKKGKTIVKTIFVIYMEIERAYEKKRFPEVKFRVNVNKTHKYGCKIII